MAAPDRMVMDPSSRGPATDAPVRGRSWVVMAGPVVEVVPPLPPPGVVLEVAPPPPNRRVVDVVGPPAVLVLVVGATVLLVVVVGPAVVVVGPPVVVVGAAVVVVVGIGPSAQLGSVNTSLSSVTAPLRASARPWTVTPLFTVIEVRARMLPTNVEPVPSVAELPTCQKTLHSWAPLISETVLDEPVMSDESVWKMKTEFGSPAPSRTSGPVRPRAPWLGPA